MNICNIFALILTLSCLSVACANTEKQAEENKAQVSTVAQEDSTIFEKIELFDDSVWMEIEQEWLKETFNTCVEAYNVEISCAECIGIYMDAQFFIDENGQLIKYEINRSRFCMKDEIEKCLMSPFENMIFPDKYKNTTFQVRLGRLLKC